jgi:hypothetical protein
LLSSSAAFCRKRWLSGVRRRFSEEASARPATAEVFAPGVGLLRADVCLGDVSAALGALGATLPTGAAEGAAATCSSSSGRFRSLSAAAPARSGVSAGVGAGARGAESAGEGSCAPLAALLRFLPG